jgi:hypothetical protein
MDYRQHQLDYGQFLISSQINYTQTYLADHSTSYSHDSMNRFLRFDTLPPRTLWQNLRDDVVQSEQGYLLFDDVVLDKRHSRKARLVRRQWSDEEPEAGKTIHLKKMPKGHRMKLFPLALSTERTDYVITNDLTQVNSDVAKQHCCVDQPAQTDCWERGGASLNSTDGCLKPIDTFRYTATK